MPPGPGSPPPMRSSEPVPTGTSTAVGPRTEVFRYAGFDFDHATAQLVCRYELDDVCFEEHITVTPSDVPVADPAAVEDAARLVHLLAGISYYKAAAPPVIDVGPQGLTPAERKLLRAFIIDGLGEFAYVNDLDLTATRIIGPERLPVAAGPRAPDNRPLIPFGGGIDSIVTVEAVRRSAPDAALFVVSKDGDRFDAIEAPGEVAGLPIIRAERRLDPKILRSRELGYLNGHVPVTGILSAIAVMAAVIHGRDAVVMSNEWSASQGNVVRAGRPVNHQWSKSLAFERAFRSALAEAVRTPVEYFSWLRAYSEVWVARRFARHTGYHPVFRSCNKAFHIDPTQRFAQWCGRCDKCCFIDLVLAPFMDAEALRAVFNGREPLDDPTLIDTFRALVGLDDTPKPFECVGDTVECQVAALLAARRPDRTDSEVLTALAAEVEPHLPGDLDDHLGRLLEPLGPDHVPEIHAAQHLVD